MVALATRGDVETALLRPLTPNEASFIAALCDQASEKLRVAVPSVDMQMAAYGVDPATGMSPVLVASVLANVIKRVLVNPRGLWSSGGESAGPFSAPSEVYAGGSRAGASTGPGELVVTAADIKQLYRSYAVAVPRSIQVAPPVLPEFDYYGGGYSDDPFDNGRFFDDGDTVYVPGV